MRSLNLDQLRAFVEVIERGSFTAAAKELNLTQPAVTHQVQELELDVERGIDGRGGLQSVAESLVVEIDVGGLPVESARRIPVINQRRLFHGPIWPGASGSVKLPDALGDK